MMLLLLLILGRRRLSRSRNGLSGDIALGEGLGWKYDVLLDRIDRLSCWNTQLHWRSS